MDGSSLPHNQGATCGGRTRPVGRGVRKRVLIGWELGAGLGHVGMLKPLARRLVSLGYEVIMALRDVGDAGEMLADTGAVLVQAPRWPQACPRGRDELKTLADVLYSIGFGEVDRLHEQAVKWHCLVRQVDPHMVIGEYSPTLALVAIGRRKYITIGSGFTVPPPCLPLPPYRFWERDPPASSVTKERVLTDTVGVVRRELGLAPLPRLALLFGGDVTGVCTYPALDCYRLYRRQAVLGPLTDRTDDPPTVDRQRSGAFVYLSGLAPDFDIIVEGLARPGVAIQAYVRDLQPTQRELMRAKGWTVHDAPQDLRAGLPGVAAVVHHGGLSTTHVAIETGTPQLVLPTSTEQVITAQGLVNLHLGLGLSRPQRTVESVADALARVVSNPVFRRRALDVAVGVRARREPGALDVLTERCGALLA